MTHCTEKIQVGLHVGLSQTQFLTLFRMRLIHIYDTKFPFKLI